MITHWVKTKEGKEYPIRFTQAVSMQLAIDEEVPANKIQEFLGDFGSWPMGRIYKFYRLAFRSGAKKAGIEFKMTDEDFIEWISEDETIMEQVLKFMIASKPEPQKKTVAKGK